jgi:hypothetical protein
MEYGNAQLWLFLIKDYRERVVNAWVKYYMEYGSAQLFTKWNCFILKYMNVEVTTNTGTH